MLSADDVNAVLVQEALFQDKRVSQYWDGKRVLGRMVSQTLNLSTPFGWDIYLLYSPGATWKNRRLPMPDFWMHQLDERSDLRLDPKMLLTEVRKAIEADRNGETIID